MRQALGQRALIIGNSGSGKSTLAERLAALFDVEPIDLDTLHWEDDAYGRKRDEDSARRMVADASANPRWIMEGVYGWLAAVAMPRATALIWLDVPWSQCREGLLARGQRRGASPQQFADLLAWAEAYWVRETSSSFAGHARLFEGFAGAKQRLKDRDDVSRFLTGLASSDRSPMCSRRHRRQT